MKIRLLAAGAAALALMGCERPAGASAPASSGADVGVELTSAPTRATDAASARQAAVAPITAEGWGALRIGMTTAEIERVMGRDPEVQVRPEDEMECRSERPARAPKGMFLMIIEGRLASIWLEKDSDIATAQGVRVGDTAARIRSIYGDDLVVRGHEYIQAPAEYLTVWSTPAPTSEIYETARGVSFHVGEDGKAYYIAAGDYTVDWVEGCG